MLSFIRGIWFWWYKPSIQGKMFGDDALASGSPKTSAGCSTSNILHSVELEMGSLGSVKGIVNNPLPAPTPVISPPSSLSELYSLLDNSSRAPRL